LNQLIREDIKIVGQLSKTLVYSYDSQNNITSIKTYGYQTISGTPLSEKKMYYQNTWKDQLTRVEYYTNGTLSYYETMTYDNSGNIILIQDSRTYYNDKTFQWDGRQLTNYGSYCNSLTFKYNDQGIRTQKIQSTCGGNVTTNYVLDGDKVLVETRSNGITIYYTYDVDGSLLSMNYNGTEYFYITNLQGDVIELRDMSGSVVVQYKYDAWGNIVYQSPGTLADINPYRYRGYRFDVETGYYYLQSRYYNPQVGRFISADGLVGETGNLLTQNMYAYAGNNPVMNVDPNGDSFLLILLISALIVWAIQDISDIVAGDVYFDPNREEIINSYKVQNPYVVIGYSIYLKYFSENKEYFSGSASGIYGEWMWHNVIYDGLTITNFIGIKQIFGYETDELIKKSRFVGLGHNIFEESNRLEVLIPSLIFEGSVSRRAIIYDFVQYLRNRGE
jgi:RHS repeat-associated protein